MEKREYEERSPCEKKECYEDKFPQEGCDVRIFHVDLSCFSRVIQRNFRTLLEVL